MYPMRTRAPQSWVPRFQPTTPNGMILIFESGKIERERYSGTLNPSLFLSRRFSTLAGTSVIAITPNTQVPSALCLANKKFENKESSFSTLRR